MDAAKGTDKAAAYAFIDGREPSPQPLNTPEQLRQEAAFHKLIKTFTNKRHQGYLMGAFREATGMRSKVS